MENNNKPPGKQLLGHGKQLLGHGKQKIHEENNINKNIYFFSKILLPE